jgi:hypothetical protein
MRLEYVEITTDIGSIRIDGGFISDNPLAFVQILAGQLGKLEKAHHLRQHPELTP